VADDDWVALKTQVKEANDIVDVVGSYIALRPAGPTFKGLCPFHDDHKPSLDVDPRRQRYTCWACGKRGDVFTFIQEHDRVDFSEALELLARRAGISLEKNRRSPHAGARAPMLEVMRWATEQMHQCLLDSPLAEAARHYLGERRLTGETVRRFALGYAPAAGAWLAERAERAGLSLEMLARVGLVNRRDEGKGFYDRFRDRVMFPIRDARGHTVGLGGRILPTSSSSAKAAKYLNSSETPLFTKSEHLYAIDQARQAGSAAGFLVVVEGYTDALMAHQMGITNVVATMGTALNARHVKHLRRLVPRVVLVFDADAGGATGVDRALEVFVSQEMDLAIATLPSGLDPCDLLVKEGPEPFRQAIGAAVDALDFKLAQVLRAEASAGVEGRRRAVDQVLRIIALAPEMPGQAGAVKRELVVNRIAQRMGLREEAVWGRLKELRAQKRPGPPAAGPSRPEARAAPASAWERQLLQVLLADPKLVPVAAAEVVPAQLEHPGLRQLLETLYALSGADLVPDFDRLRERIQNLPLVEAAWRLQEVGRQRPDSAAWLRELLLEFRKRRMENDKVELQNQLHAACDHTEAVALLRQLQQQTASLEPALPAQGKNTGA
jgi:DNA primase